LQDTLTGFKSQSVSGIWISRRLLVDASSAGRSVRAADR